MVRVLWINTRSGFWGCYFGSAGLMLAGSVFAYVRSLRRIAVNAAASALASTFFVVAFLGGLPISDAATLDRFLAHVAAWCRCCWLTCCFPSWASCAAPRPSGAPWLLAGGGRLVIALGWALSPQQSLMLSLAAAALMGFVALASACAAHCAGTAWPGWRWRACFSCWWPLPGLSWMALDRAHVPWQAHAVTALAGTAYLATMASVLWIRYSYLIELNRALAHGPSYDPVTRMRSNSETNNMVNAAVQALPGPAGAAGRDRGVHRQPLRAGKALRPGGRQPRAVRLRRAAAAHRAGPCRDGAPGRGRLPAADAQLPPQRRPDPPGAPCPGALARSVVLNTSLEAGTAAGQQTRWEAEAGVGVLRVSKSDARASSAVGLGRGMSRAALGYPSRIAWFDETSGEIVDMPVLAA
jgi:hypothetical protein